MNYIDSQRIAELDKHAEVIASKDLLYQTNSLGRSYMLEAESFITLGLSPNVDIADLDRQTQAEVLRVTSLARDLTTIVMENAISLLMVR